MVIQKTIDNINTKPLHIRKYIAYGITGASALLLVGLWLVSLTSTRLDITSTDITTIGSDDVAVLKQGIDGIIENADVGSFQAGLQNRNRVTISEPSENDLTNGDTLYDESYPITSDVPTISSPSDTSAKYPWE
jgi:hypothetical protein